MHRFLLLIGVFIFLVTCTADYSKEAEKSILNDFATDLIPYPRHMEFYRSQYVLYPQACAKSLPTTLHNRWKRFQGGMRKAILRHQMRWDSGLYRTIPHWKDSCTTFLFVRDTNIDRESYRIRTSPNGILIQYGGDAGAFYALNTFEKLLFFHVQFDTAAVAYLPEFYIEDSPRFGYRGIHIDVARHFFSIRELYKIIDALSFYHINKLHLHLTDDQGWRIEIRSHPLLHRRGSIRQRTIQEHQLDRPKRFDYTTYQGYYTQDSLRALVLYAQAHHIDIIPEIDFPCHVRAMLAAYPELSCTGRSVTVAGEWGIFKEVLCSKDHTIQVLKDVLTEIMDIFPSRYIHLGGDECPTDQWQQCKICTKWVKEQGYEDMRWVQKRFIDQLGTFVLKHGRRPVFWDEALDFHPPEGSIIMAWRGQERAYQAAKKGYDAVIADWEHYYLDHYQSLSPSEPLAIGGYTLLREVYAFEPLPDSIAPSMSEHILGIQANLWTEYVKDFSHLGYMLFPRALALAERAWTTPDRIDLHRFADAVIAHLYFLRRMGVPYAQSFRTPEYFTKNKNGNVFLHIVSPFRRGYVKYWANRMMSERFGERYTAPIYLSDSLLVRFRYFAPDRYASESVNLSYIDHDAAGKHLSIRSHCWSRSVYSSPDNLLNGIVGLGGHWPYNQEFLTCDTSGFYGIIDLVDTLKYAQLEWFFGYQPSRGVFPPKEVYLAWTNDSTGPVQWWQPKDAATKALADSAVWSYRVQLPDTVRFRYLHLRARPQKHRGKPRKMYVGEIRLWRF